MKAEELLEWALQNIHSTNWRFLLIMKTYEHKIKNLTAEQIQGIELFIELLDKDKFYMGTSDGVIRIGALKETYQKIKELNSGKEIK